MSELPDPREVRRRAETSEPLELPEPDDPERVPDDGDDSVLDEHDPAADGSADEE